MIYIVLAVVAVILLVFFNPTARKIRKINELIDKDRSICIFIMTYVGWNVTPIEGFCSTPETWGLKIILSDCQNSKLKEMYITYNSKRPTNEEIDYLYNELTKETSVVTKAHKANMPVDIYIQKYGFEKK